MKMEIGMEAKSTVVVKWQHNPLINLKPDLEETFCFSQSNRIL